MVHAEVLKELKNFSSLGPAKFSALYIKFIWPFRCCLLWLLTLVKSKRGLDCLVFDVTFTGNWESFLQAPACKWIMSKGTGKFCYLSSWISKGGLTWNLKVREFRKKTNTPSKWPKEASSLVCTWMLSSKTRGLHSLEGALPLDAAVQPMREML